MRNSGAFGRDGEINVFSRVSKSIVDSLAKHWTTTRGAEIVALSAVSAQLLDKQQKHQKFLQFLALSNCHQELSSTQRKSLQIIMEHGEKLASMIQLNRIRNQTSTENGLSGSIWDLIQLVGQKARQNTVLLMDRDNAEIMCVTILNTAVSYRDDNHMWYPSPEGLTPWYCQTVVRSGIWNVASFMINLLNEIGNSDLSVKLEFYSCVEVLVKVSLEAYSGAVTTKIEREEDHGGLLEEYWNRRDLLLHSLYLHVKAFNQGSGEVVEGQNGEIAEKLSSNLLGIAKRHEGYQTLWNLCSDYNDLELLRSLMHDSMGPKGGFSNFVFKQMYNNKQFSKLMRLGEEFPEDLGIFLKDHPDLLWLHEIFLHQFSSSSESLHLLALSDEGPTSYDIPTFADRRRLLNLSKIAAVAESTQDESHMAE